MFFILRRVFNSLWKSTKRLYNRYKSILFICILLNVLFVMGIGCVCTSVVLYEVLYSHFIPTGKSSYPVLFDYSMYYKSYREKVQNDYLPVAEVSLSTLREYHVASEHEDSSLHLEFDYVLPFVLANAHAHVYTVETQILASDSRVLSSSFQTFTTDWRFLVGGAMKSVFLFPFVMAGFTTNGELRSMSYSINTTVVMDDYGRSVKPEWMRIVIHNPEVIVTDCVLKTHVRLAGWKGFLQNHHVLCGVLFVVTSSSVMMSFNLVGACFVVLVYVSRSRREAERVALKKSVKVKKEDVKVKEEDVKVKEGDVKVKKEDVKVKKEEDMKVKEGDMKVKKEDVKVKKEEDMKVKKEDEEDAETQDDRNTKHSEDAVKHCDSFFTLLLEESESLVRRRRGY